MKKILTFFFSAIAVFSAIGQGPSTAAPDPICDQGDVISMFSNTYTDVAVSTWLTPWSQAPVTLTDLQIAGNDTKWYQDVTFLGIETVGPNLIDASGMTYFNISFWSDNATQFRVKLVDFGADGGFGGGDDTEHEITFDNPAQNEWVCYSIPLSDFTNLLNTDNIAQLILSAAPGGVADFYIDNVYYSTDNCITTAPEPTEPAANVISMFSNAYADVPVSTWLTPWSQAPVSLTDLAICGDDVKLYQDVTFLGIETVGPNLIDASNMTNFHIDFWSGNATQFRIKLVDFGADQAFGGGDDTEHELTFDNPAQNTWISYDIPLTDFINLLNTNNIAQLILSAMPNGEADFYIDNVYFSMATTADIELCVDMSCFPGVQAPSVFGAFNGWNAGANPITDPDGDGFYCATVTMNPGAQQYKFFDQIQGPENFTTLGPCNALDGVNINRVIDVVAGVDQSVMFGWATCDPTCTPPPTPNVELCVDMTCLPGTQAPSVFGFFNGWNAGANMVTDPDGDGIYCAMVIMAPGEQQFKFFDQLQGPEEFETLGSCNAQDGPNINRVITVTGDPQSFTFGWESCDEVCVPPPPPADLPITFEDPGINYDLIDFGGAVSIITTDPTDPTNTVVCTNKTQGAADFAGTVIGNSGLLNPIPFTADDTKLTVRVWSPIANTPVLLKLENSAGGPTTEVLVNTTTSMTWETLVFDFSTDPAFNIANTYNKIVIFFNFGSIGANRTYYFDDIMLCMPGAVALICPPAGSGSGCSAADVTPFADFAAFEAAGGSAVDADPASFMLINTVETGTCPVTVVHTYQISDICGTNMATCEYTTLVDAPSGPIVTCPADQVVACFEDIVVNPDDAVVVTSCGLSSVTYIKQPLITGGIPGCDGTVYTYIYKAVDQCGRVGQCEQQFLIQNNAPTVSVPAGTTVSCFEDIVVSENDATVTSDCAGDFDLNILPPVVNGPANCPGTTYTYTYQVKDFCGRIVRTDRVFTIGNNSGPIITSIPLDMNSECEPGPSLQQFTAESGCGSGAIETSVSAPTVIGTPGCNGTRVQYTYTATDECGRTATHTQTITISNDGPVINCPEVLQIFNCEDGVTGDLVGAWLASVTASSACGGSLEVTNNYNGNPGMCINNGTTNVTFRTRDACGRTTTCVGTIIMVDTEAPIIYQNPQEVLVPCNGVTQSVFNDWLSNQGGAEAIDGCWGDNISWSTNPSNPQLNCAGGPQAIVVEFIARDGCGNTSSVTGVFNTKIQPSLVDINGSITREDREAVANVQVDVQGGIVGLPDMDYTSTNGGYGLPEIEYEDNLMVVPHKNDDILNGVTTYDLILLQKHLLMDETLDSPYKRIAADVNRNGSISTFDLVLLRRLILFVDTELSSNTSWRFVEADYVFPNADNPFANTFPEVYMLGGLEEEQADFIGVKIGDLDLSALSNELMIGEDRSSLEDLTFAVEDQTLSVGETYSIDFTAQNFEQINGFQFTLDFDQRALDVVAVKDGNLSRFNENNYSLNKSDQGIITLSWNHQDVQNLKEDEVVFSLQVTARKAIRLSEALSISSEFTRAEAYQENDLMNVNLNFDSQEIEGQTAAFRLFQNQPNPFKSVTTIGFDLPETGMVSFKVYDVSGRVIYTQEGNFTKGYNQIDLNRSDLPIGGVLYYQVNTATDSDSKKMILLD